MSCLPLVREEGITRIRGSLWLPQLLAYLRSSPIPLRVIGKSAAHNHPQQLRRAAMPAPRDSVLQRQALFRDDCDVLGAQERRDEQE